MAGKIYVGPIKLPSEYQEVEYLETDGNAYIQTTHQPGVRTKTVAVFSNVTGGATPCPLFGAMDTDTEETSQYWAQWTGESQYFDECFVSAVGGSAPNFSTSTDPEGGQFTFEIGDYTVSGSCETLTSKVSYGQTSESVSPEVWDNSFVKTTVYGAIFTVNSTDGVWDTIQNGLRLHSYKTYNYSSGSYVLARDYIPCYRKADNKPGLFDTVHQVFYTNASNATGSEFICGPAVSAPQTIAQLVSKIYAGVNGAARQISKVYAGVNGVARQVYPFRTYLFSHETGDNNALTGGWSSGTFYHRTNGGTNYSMTRMTLGSWSGEPWGGGVFLGGRYSSTDGTSEKAMYVMTARGINLQPYSKLCALLHRRNRRDTDPQGSWFGVFNASSTSSTLTCKTSELGTKFLAHQEHANTVNSGYEFVPIEINISSLTGTYIILYDNFHPNMNADIEVHILDVWLE